MVRFSWLAVLALFAWISGCAPGKGDLSGKVTFNGKTVTSGTVQAFLPDGSTRTADIAPDGSYKLTGLLEGPVRLGVSSPNPKKRYDDLLALAKTEEQRKAVQAPSAEVVKTWAALPEPLARPETSGLTATVKPGETPHDLTLTGTAPVSPNPPAGPPPVGRTADKDKKK